MKSFYHLILHDADRFDRNIFINRKSFDHLETILFEINSINREILISQNERKRQSYKSNTNFTATNLQAIFYSF